MNSAISLAAVKHARRGRCIMAAAGDAAAQPYPTRPIRMVVGFLARRRHRRGGAHYRAAPLRIAIGQQVVIENRPGATGTVSAAAMVAKAAPDGYTIMMGHVSVNAIAPSLFPNLGYDVIKGLCADHPDRLGAQLRQPCCTRTSAQVHNTSGRLIAYAKANPGKLTFSRGRQLCSSPHLAGEMFKTMAHVDLVHVPYKGSGQSMQDLLAGQHLVAFDTVAAASPFVRSNRLRALGISSTRRMADFPDVPTVEEAGTAGLCDGDVVRRVRSRRHVAGHREQAARRDHARDARARR